MAIVTAKIRPMTWVIRNRVTSGIVRVPSTTGRSRNVIVGDRVQSLESHRRSTAEVDNQSQQHEQSSKSKERISQDEATGTTVTVTIEDYGGTLDTIAQYKNHQIHIEGGTPGEKRRIKLKKGNGYLIGKHVKVQE